jgi:hypothetical protein
MPAPGYRRAILLRGTTITEIFGPLPDHYPWTWEYADAYPAAAGKKRMRLGLAS